MESRRRQLRRRTQEAGLGQRPLEHANYSAIARRWAGRCDELHGSLNDLDRSGRPRKLDAERAEVLRGLGTEPHAASTDAALARELGGDASATSVAR